MVGRKRETRECKNKDLKQIKEVFPQLRYDVLMGPELIPSEIMKEEN